jgi:DinB superfamily
MADLQTSMADNRQAVTAFLAAAHAVSPSRWAHPRAPGKWSPGQVTEHVALAYELSRGLLHGSFPGSAAPRILRPFIRMFFLNPVLKRGRFGPGNKTPEPFEPAESPPAPEALIARLESAVGAFDTDLAAASRSGQSTLDHPFFGKVLLADYVRLQAIHTQHHREQLSTAAS